MTSVRVSYDRNRRGDALFQGSGQYRAPCSRYKLQRKGIRSVGQLLGLRCKSHQTTPKSANDLTRALPNA